MLVVQMDTSEKKLIISWNKLMIFLCAFNQNMEKYERSMIWVFNYAYEVHQSFWANGLHTRLTDWLPASSTDSFTCLLKCCRSASINVEYQFMGTYAQWNIEFNRNAITNWYCEMNSLIYCFFVHQIPNCNNIFA